jgi:dihydropteroate synthase
MHWKTSRREISLDRPLIMGILNATPDSFSDGGQYAGIERAVARAEEMIAEEADIIDIGGESTRPGSELVLADEEISRVVPIITAITSRFDVPVSIDTWKSEVAREAVNAGAEIINDISGLRWDDNLAGVAAGSGAGIVLMHSRGEFADMHSQPPVDDIFREVSEGLKSSIAVARNAGVLAERIVLDVGIGFGKTLDQNLRLIGKLQRITPEFPEFPILVGASRKSFIGKLLNGIPPEERLAGSLAAAVIAAVNGAKVLRVHDVRETVQAVRTALAITNA